MSFPLPSDALIDRIYQAAVLPDGWPAVLLEIAAMVGGQGGLLFAGDQTSNRHFASPGTDIVYKRFIEAGYAQQNLARIGRLIRRRHSGFISEIDFSTAEEMATLPMFTDLLTPIGYVAAAATAIDGLAGEQLIMTVEGFASLAAAATAVPVLDSLRPHLARASLLAARLGLERARTAVAALAMIGVPAAMVDARGALFATNPLFDARLAGLGTDSPRGLRLMDPAADRSLAGALAMIGRCSAPVRGHGVSIPVRRDRGFPLVMHVLPMRGAARDIFTKTLAVLLLAERGSRPVPGAELIQALLDLSPAEARLARALAAGLTMAEAALASRLSVATVRTQLKSIFLKTGLKRQAELTALLVDLAPPG